MQLTSTKKSEPHISTSIPLSSPSPFPSPGGRTATAASLSLTWSAVGGTSWTTGRRWRRRWAPGGGRSSRRRGTDTGGGRTGAGSRTQEKRSAHGGGLGDWDLDVILCNSLFFPSSSSSSHQKKGGNSPRVQDQRQRVPLCAGVKKRTRHAVSRISLFFLNVFVLLSCTTTNHTHR